MSNAARTMSLRKLVISRRLSLAASCSGDDFADTSSLLDIQLANDNSTRRFFALPCTVSFEATGFASP